MSTDIHTPPVIDNREEYKQSADPDAFQVNVTSLVKARLEIQRQMARIVKRVSCHQS